MQCKSNLKIIDLTDKDTEAFYKASLSTQEFKKLQGSPVVWRGELNCQTLMDRLSAENLDARDLGEVIRQEIIPPKDFRFMRHYDLRCIEKVVGHWIDLLLSPFGLSQGKSGERTSAIDGAILLLNNIFLRFNDLFAWEWIEIGAEGNTTKNHKFDGVLTTRINPMKSIRTLPQMNLVD